MIDLIQQFNEQEVNIKLLTLSESDYNNLPDLLYFFNEYSFKVTVEPLRISK